MSRNYNNYRRNNGGSYNGYYNDRGSYGRSGSNRSYGNRDSDKKSGAVYTKISKGEKQGLYAVNAWRMTKRGLVTASCMPKDGVEHTSGAGDVYLCYSVEVMHRDLGTKQLYWTLMNKSTRKLFIKELGLVISPNGSGYTSSGKRVSGYFGKAFK